MAAALLTTLALTAFASSPEVVRSTAPAPADRLLPAGPPRPQVVASAPSIRLQLPVPQARLTALGYHRAPNNALALHPAGDRANQGFLSRLVHKLVGGGGSRGMRWYQLSGSGQGPPTSMLDAGAPAGTDVYSPVDATVVGISKFVLGGKVRGVQLDLQPVQAPFLVVSLTRLRIDPSLRVGDSVQAGTSKVGSVLDLSRVEQQALGRYTQDGGNHVSIEVRAGSDLNLP